MLSGTRGQLNTCWEKGKLCENSEKYSELERSSKHETNLVDLDYGTFKFKIKQFFKLRGIQILELVTHRASNLIVNF